MKKAQPNLTTKITALTLGATLLLAGASLARAADAPAPAPLPAPAISAPPMAVEPHIFGGVVADAVELTATVEKINYETREVTLMNKSGEAMTFTAGPAVQRLADIKQGDTITVVYAEAVKVMVTNPGASPSREDSVEMERAGKDKKPGGAVMKTTRVVGSIEAMDIKARTATLKGPKGSVTINVGPDAVNFEKFKVGDSVLIEYTQAIAAAVTKSAPAPVAK
jgi:hypothetical protein